MVLVEINENGKWVSKDATNNLVYVIVPGAGTYTNKDMYNKLAKVYNLVYIGKSGGEYDKYPLYWENNGMVDMSGNNLGGLGLLVKERMERYNEIPSLILCGSRGGQVTIGKIWESIWRGRTIMINAGSLLTQTRIPRGVKLLFIIMEYDYFTNINNYPFLDRI